MVLDNFDHLVQGVGILAELFAAIPGIQMLVTTRERLNLLGEWVFVLECLPYPHLSEDQSQFLLDHNMRTQLENYSSVVMFTQCARRRDASFRLTEENQLAVLKICQLVNGIPLALELAASWINILSCEEIAREIQLDASFLAATTRDIPRGIVPSEQFSITPGSFSRMISDWSFAGSLYFAAVSPARLLRLWQTPG